MVRGMGILVLTIAILPMFGVGGMQIFRAEASDTKIRNLHPGSQRQQRLYGQSTFF